MEYTRRDILKAAGAAGVAGLAGCSRSGNSDNTTSSDGGTTPGTDTVADPSTPEETSTTEPTTAQSGPVYEAAEDLEKIFEEDAENYGSIPNEVFNEGFVEVEETGDHTYEVTIGSEAFLGDESASKYNLCSDPTSEDVREAFTRGCCSSWMLNYGGLVYENLGPLNTVHQEPGEDAIESYAFRFEEDDVTVTYEASGERMDELALDEESLDARDFLNAFFEGAEASCE